MAREELARARAALAAAGADWALLASVENVTYVSGWEAPTPYGPMAHLAPAPSLALLDVAAGTTFLLVHGFFVAGATAAAQVDAVLSYELVQLFPPYATQDPRDNFSQAFRDLLRQAGIPFGRGGRVAVEEGAVPSLAARLLAEAAPTAITLDATPALASARRTKTAGEIARLRATAEIINTGQKELARQCRTAGVSDWAIWAAITEAMHRQASKALYISGELVTGLRCREIAPGGPVGYVTQPGDLARLDVSPRFNGYWGDLTNTLVIAAEPTARQRLFKNAARDGFEAAAGMLRPGRKARDAYEAAEHAFARHGLKPAHYLGHQIGLTVNEGPWLIPSDDTIIENGMVFSVESGTYEGVTGELGARVEKSVIVRDSGPEIFPDFDWEF